MARNDVLISGNDLPIRDGDFVLGPSDDQHVYLIILLPRGAWKQSPLVGVGESRLLNGPVDGALRRTIQLQLEADGYRLRTLTLSDSKLDIDFDPV